MKQWLKILEAFRSGRFPNYYYGLTPRFIIGGCQTPIGKKFETENFAFIATKSMFEEMQTFNNDGLVVVPSNCGIHNGPVLSLLEYEWSENIISTSFQEIWDRYGEEIIDGNYHIDTNEREILEGIFSI